MTAEENRSSLPTYDLYGDLTSVSVEGDEIVLRISKRNSPYLSAGQLKKSFLGWQIALTVRKIKRVRTGD